MLLRSLLTAVAVLVLHVSAGLAAEVTAEKSEKGDKVVVKIDGQPFAEYLILSGTKPIVWPIYGPTGKPMTRDFPMKEDTDEKSDHPWHRSLWCSHGDVNGVDFWQETFVAKNKKNKKKESARKKGEHHGTIQHLEFEKIAGGKPAVIVTRNAWIAPDGKKYLEDERTLRFDGDPDARWIDFDITLKATDGPVKFGDTKEGFFCMRFAEGLRANAKKGAKLVNSDGLVDEKAWGRPAVWVDDYGAIDGQLVGVAIFNHPGSVRYPTRWHARTYGLIGANPFCNREFLGKKINDQTVPDGGLTIASGESATFRYRVLLHKGDVRQGQVAQRFAEYAKEAK
jgi:hypothetical protein